MSQKERWQDRKERLARERLEHKRTRARMVGAIAAAAAVLVVTVAAYLVAIHGGEGGGGYAPASATNSSSGSNVVTIPVSEVGSTARFYTYDSGGTSVRFFAALGTDGNVHVATDACDVCYSSHKGYHQSGAQMQCNNCGKTFQIDHIGTRNTSGGCWPSYLPMSSGGSDVQIAKSALDAKAYMFA